MRFFRCLVPVITSTISLLTSNAIAHSQAEGRIKYLSLVEEPVIHTPSHRVHAFSSFDITFNLHRKQQQLKLALEPNHDILAEDAQVQYLDAEGNIARTEPIDRSDHKVFKGWSWVKLEDGSWDRVGWARVVIRQDGLHPLFEGAFTIMNDHHHILMRSTYIETKHELDPHLDDTTEEHMIVFRDSDIGRQIHLDLKRSIPMERSCEADRLSFNSDPNHPVYRSMPKRDTGLWGSMSFDSLFGLSKRQGDTGGLGGNSGTTNLKSTIGSTAGCPTTRKVALIGVATDCEYTGSFNSSETARKNVITVVNTASQVYEQTFNITLGLRNLTITPADCPTTAPASTPWNVPCGDTNNPAVDITERLNLFSEWRGSQNDKNAYWTLMSRCNTGSEVGLAWLGQLCITEVTGASSGRNGSQSVTGANVVVRTTTEWQVFAHESGHTFGAVHDCDQSLCSTSAPISSQCCPYSANTCDAGGQFIMNPTSGRGITQFSPCTVGNICSAMGRNSIQTSCLSDNRGVVTITGSQCGNGIVEEGEDCDCGGEQGCGNNNCCDPNTCKFKSGAVCDDSNEDCCRNCQFASASTVCRASTGQCDPAETCTGTSSICPQDSRAPDGQACGNSLSCASGQCTSRDLQCKTLMGSLIGSNDTYACDSSSCTLSCASPSFPPNMCSSLQQNFLDGTPCGSGGKCSNGVCRGSTFGKEVTSFLQSHKNLVIGLSAGLGGIFFLLLSCCIFQRCRQRKHRKKSAPQQFRQLPGSRWAGPPPPPVYWTQRVPQPWHTDSPPPYPAQAYGTTLAARGRMPSVRYA